MSDSPLSRELQYFIDHQDELVEQYGDKVIVIKDQAVIGAYESTWDAVQQTTKEHELGTFLVQPCEPGPECYTAQYYGHRVSVASS